MPDDDSELERFLARDSRIARQYRALPAEEPPPALDARIRAEAAREAAPRRGPSRSPLRWLRTAALAATVLVSFSLLFQLGVLGPGTRRADEATGPVTVTLDPPAGPGASSMVMKDEDTRVAPLFPAAPTAAEPRLERDATADAGPPPAAAESEQATTIVATTRKPVERLQDVPVAVSSFRAERSLEGQQAEPEAAAVAAADAPSPAIAAPSRAAVERAIAAARRRLAAAPAPAAPGGFTGEAARAPAADAAPPAATERLRRIVGLYDEGRLEEASTALADYAREFPGDEVSRLLVEPAR